VWKGKESLAEASVAFEKGEGEGGERIEIG